MPPIPRRSSPIPEAERQPPGTTGIQRAVARSRRGSKHGVQHLRACAGHTVNISQHGLAVMLHAQNIDEQYLLGGEGSMAIELDLPNGLSIEIHATPVRYEKLDEGYLIGARISEMSGTQSGNV